MIQGSDGFAVLMDRWGNIDWIYVQDHWTRVFVDPILSKQIVYLSAKNKGVDHRAPLFYIHTPYKMQPSYGNK